MQQLQYTVDQLQEHCSDCEEEDTTLELSILKNINESKFMHIYMYADKSLGQQF